MPGRRVAVVTDDAAALPGAAAGAGPSVLAMPLAVDGQPLRTDGRQRLAGVCAALAAGARVTTSRPSPGEALRVYRDLEAQGFEGIVSVHCSAQLSGTVASARIASAATGIPVEVVDTRSAAMGEGFGVLAAWEASGRGAGVSEVARAARGGSRGHTVLVWVPGLESLRRGGRVGFSAAAVGEMLPAQSLLRLSGGRLVLAEVPPPEAGMRARLVRRSARALATSSAACPEVVVHHLGDPEAARGLGQEIAAASGVRAVVSCPELPAVLAAHVGLGAVVVVVRG